MKNLIHNIKAVSAALLLGLNTFAANPSGKAHKVIKLMGCRFEISAVAQNDTLAWEAVKAGIEEIDRIEKLISSWDTNSQTSAVNRQAGLHPVKVDKELFDLIYRAKKVSALTQGAFDITFASMDRIWRFDQQEQTLTDSFEVAQARAKIDFEKIILNSQDTTVFLLEKGMKIGFGALGKGYAANRARQLMGAMPKVVGGVVNASGDLLAWGQNSESEKWKIKIADPSHPDRPVGWLEVSDMAIVTSGDYEKYFTCQGKRYAHIINPKTGYPTTGITSVTIICPDAELADALATSLFVLGRKQGLALVNKIQGVEAVVITNNGSIHQSANFNLKYY